MAVNMAPSKRRSTHEEKGAPISKKQKTVALKENGTKWRLSTTDVLPIDRLEWQEVALPDRLEDAEGFFGLEEIGNVEVVRDTKSGNIIFKPLVGSLNAKHSSKKIPAVILADGLHPDYGDEGSEWEGFADKASSETIALSATNRQSRKTKSHEVSKTNVKKQNKSVKRNGSSSKATVNISSTPKNAYDILDGQDDETDVSAWMSLGLSPETLSSLARLHFTKPTPIQIASIPEILDSHDVIGKASTGSGKTLAFGIPILEHYLSTSKNVRVNEIPRVPEQRSPPVAMILSPTRELAHQLFTHLTDLCSIPSIIAPRIATVTGGLSLQKQQRLLLGADIIIGTPGRLWEIISEGQGLLGWLKKIKFLVIDEADRLLSEGHFKEVDEILSSLDRKNTDTAETEQLETGDLTGEDQRQTLVFSATFQKELQQKLAGKGIASRGELMGKQESMEYLLKKLNFREGKPKFIDVNPVSQMASGLKEGIVECAGMEKDLYLYALLLHHQNTRTLVFTNSISSVRRLTPFLQNLNIDAHALHSQMPQKARLRAVERFSSPSQPGSILIASDVAARGLDIPSVNLILHYHVPRAADMYVHRSGRTARAQKSGTSILLCAPEEVVGVRRLIAKVHARGSKVEDDKRSRYFIRTIDLDRRLVARLRARVTLAKTITDASLAKVKKGHENNWLRTAADELGVDYDSDDFAAEEGSKKGRGQGRRKAEKEARGLSKGEVGALRGELKVLLCQRVNVGVSENYLSAGGIDIDELLEDGFRGEFLGKVDGISLE